MGYYIIIMEKKKYIYPTISHKTHAKIKYVIQIMLKSIFKINLVTKRITRIKSAQTLFINIIISY